MLMTTSSRHSTQSYRVVKKKCTECNASSFCNRLQQNRAIFAKMLIRYHCLPINA